MYILKFKNRTNRASHSTAKQKSRLTSPDRKEGGKMSALNMGKFGERVARSRKVNKRAASMTEGI